MFLFKDSKDSKKSTTKKLKEKVVSKVKKDANKIKNKASLMKGGTLVDFKLDKTDQDSVIAFNKNVLILKYYMTGIKDSSLDETIPDNIVCLDKIIEMYKPDIVDSSTYVDIYNNLAEIYDFLEIQSEETLKEDVTSAANQASDHITLLQSSKQESKQELEEKVALSVWEYLFSVYRIYIELHTNAVKAYNNALAQVANA